MAAFHDVDLNCTEVERHIVGKREAAIDHMLVRNKILRRFSGLADTERSSETIRLVCERIHDQQTDNALCRSADVLIARSQRGNRQRQRADHYQQQTGRFFADSFQFHCIFLSFLY